jgi:hypothetical protein
MKKTIINNSEQCGNFPQKKWGIPHTKQLEMEFPEEYQAVPEKTIFLTNKNTMKKEVTKTESTKKEKKSMKEIYLQTPYNRANYYSYIMATMKKKEPLSLTMGIEPNFGVPYYQTETNGVTKNIYITKEICKQIYAYLKNGTISYKIPNVDDISYNKDEDFIWRLLKIDRANKVTSFTTSTKEYKAVYPNGTINYGKLPYTRNELKGKLDTLVSKK